MRECELSLFERERKRGIMCVCVCVCVKELRVVGVHMNREGECA